MFVFQMVGFLFTSVDESLFGYKFCEDDSAKCCPGPP